MAEYIKREAAYNAIVNNYDTDEQLRALDAIPAADAIEELRKRIDFLMNCIYEAEDALDRGADNEWARASLEKAERGQDDV